MSQSLLYPASLRGIASRSPRMVSRASGRFSPRALWAPPSKPASCQVRAFLNLLAGISPGAEDAGPRRPATRRDGQVAPGGPPEACLRELGGGMSKTGFPKACSEPRCSLPVEGQLLIWSWSGEPGGLRKHCGGLLRACVHSKLTVNSQYTHSTLTVHSQYTHVKNGGSRARRNLWF